MKSSKNNIPKGAYIMRIIPFSSNNGDCDSQISSFFSHLSVFKLLGECGGTKARGTAVRKIFSTVFSAPFKGKSIYRILMDDKDDSGGLLPEKDSIYRFLSMPMIDCNEITSKLASVIQDEIRLPGSEWHFVLDDSAYKRNRSKNAELATKCFDHTGVGTGCSPSA